MDLRKLALAIAIPLAASMGGIPAAAAPSRLLRATVSTSCS